MKFNGSQLVEDCGGPKAVAEKLGKSRTAFYRAKNTGYVGTPTLCELLKHYPKLNFMKYFEEDDD
jgi:hypothetical protein